MNIAQLNEGVSIEITIRKGVLNEVEANISGVLRKSIRFGEMSGVSND